MAEKVLKISQVYQGIPDKRCKMIKLLGQIIPGANSERLVPPQEISLRHDPDSLEFADISDNPKRFAWEVLLYPDYLMKAGKYFRNQIVVDLGAGESLDGCLLSQIAGARAYVGVEPYNVFELYREMQDDAGLIKNQRLVEELRKLNHFLPKSDYQDKRTVARLVVNINKYVKDGKAEIPATLVPEDMLTAMRRLPDSSVSLLACGIDRCIMFDDNYARLVEQQIERVLHPEGAFIEIHSRFYPRNIKLNEEFAQTYFKVFTK